VRKKQTPLYAGLFVIATMACFDVSAMDTQKSLKKNSIIWTFCGILWKRQYEPSPQTHCCIRSEEKSKTIANFVEAQIERIKVQKMLAKAKENGCSPCLKALKQQKEKAFKKEKKYWRLAHPWLYTSRKDQHQ